MVLNVGCLVCYSIYYSLLQNVIWFSGEFDDFLKNRLQNLENQEKNFIEEKQEENKLKRMEYLAACEKREYYRLKIQQLKRNHF